MSSFRQSSFPESSIVDRIPLVLFLGQGRVIADRPQGGVDLQDQHLRTLNALGLDLLHHPAVVGAGQHPLVEIDLEGRQLDLLVHQDLRRQILGHVLLEPPHDKRTDAILQVARPLPHRIPLDLVVTPVLVPKALACAQEAGHRKVEQRPQFLQLVLDGRPREGQLVLRLEWP